MTPVKEMSPQFIYLLILYISQKVSGHLRVDKVKIQFIECRTFPSSFWENICLAQGKKCLLLSKLGCVGHQGQSIYYKFTDTISCKSQRKKTFGKESTFKNSATFAANCCCSNVHWFPCQVKTEEPDCRRKHSAEFSDVATWTRKHIFKWCPSNM